jgi:hypothetical protein
MVATSFLTPNVKGQRRAAPDVESSQEPPRPSAARAGSAIGFAVEVVRGLVCLHSPPNAKRPPVRIRR